MNDAVDADTPQKKLERIAWLLETEGAYVKANHCYEIIEYIDYLESQLKETK